MTSSDTPDTGAGTPLTAEEERRLRQGWWDEPPETLIPRLLATLDAARARPATDPAGLDGLVEELYGLGTSGETMVRIEEAVVAIRSRWSLPVADGPGPEERP